MSDDGGEEDCFPCAQPAASAVPFTEAIEAVEVRGDADLDFPPD